MTGAIGRRIRALRETREWSQEDLAREAGVPVSWLAMLEDGVSDQPSGDSLGRLGRVLGVSVHFLGTGEREAEAQRAPSEIDAMPPQLAKELREVIEACRRSEQACRMTHRFAADLRELFLESNIYGGRSA